MSGVNLAPAGRWPRLAAAIWRARAGIVASFTLAGIGAHFGLRLGGSASATSDLPLLAVLVAGGLPLVAELALRLWRRQFGSDLLAGISIVCSLVLHEYLAGTIVVLMLSGGGALETYAMRHASSALEALASRMPAVAHRREGERTIDVPLAQVGIGDVLVIHPHEVSPVDGVVIEGRSAMDESFLTGEPFKLTKIPGVAVISGALNGESVLTVKATRRPEDSRYAKIMEVMRESEENRPVLRRLGDRLGAWYTPLAIVVAGVAWAITGEPVRFLAVIVAATPCPLLIAIPVAIVGSISRCARQGIIVKSPVALERIGECRTAIFDKTGTLTYGEPRLTEAICAPGFDQVKVLALVGELERYSKHPLAKAILQHAESLEARSTPATEVSEPPGEGLRGLVAGHQVTVSSRGKVTAAGLAAPDELPPAEGGLECAAVIDGKFAAIFRFRDAPRSESRAFLGHLGPRHGLTRLMIVSGDRESEVRHLADQVGIAEVHAQKTPEEKLAIVRRETAAAKTVYVGDGINDAPAMLAATVGVALGQNSDVAAKAADVVILQSSLGKLDEFIHISRRMLVIALQSALGGIALSLGCMIIAAFGWLPPVGGAVSQEVIDLAAVVNALRAALPPRVLKD